jgi:hypothetical protein
VSQKQYKYFFKLPYAKGAKVSSATLIAAELLATPCCQFKYCFMPNKN